MNHRLKRAGLAVAGSLLIASPALAQFDAPRGRLTETLRISGADEDFTRIGAVFIASDGRIGITQPADFRAFIYSSDGKRLASFGGRGDGPGEFRSMQSSGWIGDTVWIYDNTARRVSLFAGGKHLRSVTFASVTAGPQLTSLPPGAAAYPVAALLPGGAFVAARSVSARENPPTVFVRVSPDAQVERVLIQHPQSAAIMSVPTAAGGMLYTSVPLLTDYADFVAPDGNRIGSFHIVTSARPEASLVVVSSKGDSVIRRVYPFTAVQITQAEKDSVIAERLKGLQGPSTVSTPSGTTPNVTRAVPQSDLDAFTNAAKARMPSVHSPIATARFGIDNTIWVQQRPIAGGARWTMLNERGDPELTVTLPANARLLQASRTTLWTSHLDADELPILLRYRVDR